MTNEIAPTGEATNSPLSIADAAASLRGHEPPAREVGVSDAYDHGDAGIRQAAEDLGRKRRQREEQQQVSEEFAAEIERAWPQAQAKLKAQADELEFAEAFERGQKLKEKGNSAEGWSLKGAADVHAAKREYARALAEQDLAEAILANREEDAQQASRDQRRLENEQREQLQQPGDAQQRLSRHAQATKLAQADAVAASKISQIALEHHRLVAHAKGQFPELVGKSADEQTTIVRECLPEGSVSS
jgi:hypothetical protein